MKSDRRSGAVQEVLSFLQRDGLQASPASAEGEFTVTAVNHSRQLEYKPSLLLPEALVQEYLDGASRGSRTFDDAVDLFIVNVIEELTVHQHAGRNYTTSLGIRRGADRRAEFFAENAVPAGRDVDLPGAGEYEWRADRP